MSQTDGEVNTSSSQRYHPLQTGDAPYLKYTGFSFFLCSSGRDHNSRLLPAYVWPWFVWSVWLWGITLSSAGLVAELSPKSYTEAGAEISGGGGRGSLISNSTVLRWVVVKAIFKCIINCEGQIHKDSVQKAQLFKRKESRSGIKPRSFCLPAKRFTARPNRLTRWAYGDGF